MNEVYQMLPDASEAQPAEALPAACAAYRIPAAAFAWARFPLGKVLSNYLPGESCALWVTHFFIDAAGAFSRRLPKPSFECVVPFCNSFNCYRPSRVTVRENGFNLFHTSSLQEVVEVKAGQTYSIINIRFERAFLGPYATKSPRLAHWLREVEKGKASSLLPTDLYLNPPMIAVMNQLLRQDYPPELAPVFTEIKVKEWLLLLLNRMETATPAQKFKEADLQKGEKVKEIILQDFEQFHTIRQLARMVGTNEHKLKAVFRHLYGTTIFDYSRSARLEYARQLLLETDWTLQYIALAVGYPEASNFSMAFKQHYGYSPGFLRKKYP